VNVLDRGRRSLSRKGRRDEGLAFRRIDRSTGGSQGQVWTMGSEHKWRRAASGLLASPNPLANWSLICFISQASRQGS
jgi:hypothetical protein